MRWSGIITAVIVFLSFAVALENFGKIGLFWKLIALAVGAAIVLYILVDPLTKWVKPKIKPGFKKVTSSKSYKRHTLSVLFLTIICIISVIIALIIVNLYNIRVEELPSANNKFKFWIRGAIPIAKKVSVQLPPHTKTKCTLKDPPKHRADSLMEDWNSANPHLQLSNFSRLQSIFVECAPRIDFNSINFRIEPPSILVLLPADRAIYKNYIFVIGGILWIASLIFFFVFLQYRR
jgi:hypothetical protein